MPMQLARTLPGIRDKVDPCIRIKDDDVSGLDTLYMEYFQVVARREA